MLDAKQKRYSIIVFLASLLNSGFELIGVAIILPFIEMVEDPYKLMNKELIKRFSDFFSIYD